MPTIQILLVAVAGFGAGFINAVVGSGSLITFPTLVALGFAPVTANVSNNIGLVPGGLSSIWGYRGEFAGQRRAAARLLPWSMLGGLTGALLLLQLPSRVFSAVVPVLIVIALVLVMLQPRIVRAFARQAQAQAAVDPGTRADPDAAGAEFRPETAGETEPAPGHDAPTRPSDSRPPWTAPLLVVGVLICGVYGGYFGAAQGVLAMAILGALHDSNLQRSNAMKNLLVTAVNLVAAAVFLVISPGHIDWRVVGLIAIGSIAGATTGAKFGRRLSPTALRVIIVAVATVALARLAMAAL